MSTLLSTAPTLDAIRDAVTRFYCGDSKTLIPEGPDNWKIVGTMSGDTVPGVRVVRSRNRFRFEAV